MAFTEGQLQTNTHPPTPTHTHSQTDTPCLFHLTHSNKQSRFGLKQTHTPTTTLIGALFID